MTTIAVIDGMGGGIGVQIVTQLRQELPLAGDAGVRPTPLYLSQKAVI